MGTVEIIDLVLTEIEKYAPAAVVAIENVVTTLRAKGELSAEDEAALRQRIAERSQRIQDA